MMNLWNSNDHQVQVWRTRREDRPYVVQVRYNDEVVGSERWFVTEAQAMEYARQRASEAEQA